MSIINKKKNMITNCIKVPGMICMIDLLTISLEKKSILLFQMLPQWSEHGPIEAL